MLIYFTNIVQQKVKAGTEGAILGERYVTRKA